jgi:hypothetical protein
MDQCKAKTNSGTQCVRAIKAPSRSLCTSHQKVLARGNDVVNAQTGRKFPKPR